MSQAILIILFLGAVQGALLSVFLFSIKTNRISNRLLGLLTLFWAIIIASFALQSEGMYEKFPHLLAVISRLLFTLFPLFYLQVKYLVSEHTHFDRKDLWHFLPFLVLTLSYMDFYFTGAEEKLRIHNNEPLYYEIVGIISNEVVALQGVIYSILALLTLSKYDRKIKDYHSNVNKRNLKVQYIGISLSLFAWIIGIIGIHLELLDVQVNLDLFIFVYLTLVLIIYIISYAALTSPEIFKLDESQTKVVFLKSQLKVLSRGGKPKAPKGIAETKVEDTAEQSNDTEMVEEINEKLLLYIENEKPYLNPELSLQDLADKLDVKRHHLSNVINQKHNKNFYEFINQYRIIEVKAMLTDPENKHLKLISIAYDAGFNSKATFNRIFKQACNMTPSQYISNQQLDLKQQAV